MNVVNCLVQIVGSGFGVYFVIFVVLLLYFDQVGKDSDKVFVGVCNVLVLEVFVLGFFGMVDL